jgi:hypothetical protein
MKISEFADAIINLFPPFRWDEETHQAWTSAVVRECRGFSPEDRSRAFDELVRSHKGTTPPVARVLELCNEAKRWRDAEERKGSFNLDGRVDTRPANKRLWDYSDARNKTVREALGTPLAKRALKEDWHLALRDFVRVHGALPATPAEINSCIGSARGFVEGMAILKSKPPEPDEAQRDVSDAWVAIGRGLNRSLMRFGMTMLQKRDEVARIIEGE